MIKMINGGDDSCGGGAADTDYGNADAVCLIGFV